MTLVQRALEAKFHGPRGEAAAVRQMPMGLGVEDPAVVVVAVRPSS